MTATMEYAIHPDNVFLHRGANPRTGRISPVHAAVDDIHEQTFGLEESDRENDRCRCTRNCHCPDDMSCDTLTSEKATASPHASVDLNQLLPPLHIRHPCTFASLNSSDGCCACAKPNIFRRPVTKLRHRRYTKKRLKSSR